jgi:beta-galactosidase GanA
MIHIPSDKNHDEKLLIGVSWYPEMWPAEEWPRDITRMTEIGFNIVRMFEFAWHKFEPEEGQYDFDWARRVMDLCAEAGIAVMIGTPTAAPPAWLTTKYPDVLRTDPDGKRATHGGRKHYSVYSQTYRALCAKIVGKMAETFSGHPALHSWQIDNEMASNDYGDEAKRGFREYLKKKFGTVEAMNKAWGLEIWSQAYQSFDQVPMPVAAVGSIEVPERHNPSLVMAVSRYNNEAWTSFIKLQCDIIRQHSDKPITTNMTAGLGMNWFQHNRLLDRVGFSMYRDVNHYHWNWQNFDRMRAEKPAPYWLLETAPNWSGGGKQWNIHHDEHGILAMSWMSHLMGGSMILYWQWREHWAGQEMQHGTLVTATGKWRPNKNALAQLCADCAKHGRWLLDHPPQQAQVGIVLSNEAAWAFSIDPIDDDMRYEVRWREDHYLRLARNHVWRDVIGEDADFSRYRVLVLPLMPIVKEATKQRLRDWVRQGGHLILGPLTGYRTEEFTAWRDREFGGLEELIGAESSLRFTVHWMEDRVTVELADGETTRTRNWCEGFRCTTGEALAHYRGGYGNDHVAIVRNKFGKGTVTTLGCAVNESVHLKLVKQILTAAGVEPVATGSGNVIVVPRADATGQVAGYGIVNITESEQTITLKKSGKDLLSGRTVGAQTTLEPLQVMLVAIR